MKRVLAPGLLVALTAVVASAAAAPGSGVVKIKATKEYGPYEKIVLTAADFPYKNAEFTWDIEGSGAVDYEQLGTKVYVWAAPGKYTVRLTAISWDDKKFQTAKWQFTVSGTPLPPPGPGPGPDPGPGPGPTPTEVKNPRVLIVYESGQATELTAGQRKIIFGKALRDYLNSKTVVGSDGKTKEWRIWDKDVDTSAAPKVWQDLMARPRKSVPWIVISGDGGVAFEGPIEADDKAQMVVLDKYLAPKGKGKKVSIGTVSRPALAGLKKAG